MVVLQIRQRQGMLSQHLWKLMISAVLSMDWKLAVAIQSLACLGKSLHNFLFKDCEMYPYRAPI